MDLNKLESVLVTHLSKINDDNDIITILDRIFNISIQTREIQNKVNNEFKDMLILISIPLDTITIIYNNSKYIATLNSKDKTNNEYVNKAIRRIRELYMETNVDLIEEGLDSMGITNIIQTI